LRFASQNYLMKLKIFVSCGQVTTEELDLGHQICTIVNSHDEFEAYFADMQSSLHGLNENILGQLGTSFGLITVMHPRGKVSVPGTSSFARASVWIEQEIAIAAYIQRTRKQELKVAAYVHESIQREGLRQLLQLNPIQFKHSGEVLAHLTERLKSWKPSPLVIHSAFYRPVHGERPGVDVTSQVIREIKDGTANFKVSTELFGDPFVNLLKELAVEYSVHGEHMTKNIPQDQVCTLP